MSAYIKNLAQHVVDGYAKELSSGDDEQMQNLVDLGDWADSIVEICDDLALAAVLLQKTLNCLTEHAVDGGLHDDIRLFLEQLGD